MIRIAAEPFESPAATALRERHQAELIERYGWDTEPGHKPTAADVPVFLVAREDGGEAVGCGGLRPIEPGLVEIKRMYVLPDHRGSGIGKLLLAALEDEARALGAERVVLETGSAQHEAVGLYETQRLPADPLLRRLRRLRHLALLRAGARLYAVARG